MRRMPCSLGFAGTLVLVLSVGVRGQSYEGVYASGRLALTLHRDGDAVSGSVRIGGADNPLTGTVRDDRITGTFTSNGTELPFEAGFEGKILVVTSGGVSHRLVQQVTEGNPLSDPALSTPSPIETAPPAGGSETPEHEYPKTVSLAPGLVLRFPESWTLREAGDFKALIPAAADGTSPHDPKSMYLAQAVPWPGQAKLDSPETANQIGAVLAQFMPGLERDGAVERLGAATTDGFRLRFKPKQGGSASGNVDVLIKSRGDKLVIVMGVGDSAELAANKASVLAMFALIGAELKSRPAALGADGGSTAAQPEVRQAANAALDAQLLGTWRSSAGFSDIQSGTSIATESVYTFKADGTYTLGSRAIGGNSSVGMDTGLNITQRGTWTATGGVLKTLDSGGSARETRYLWYQGQLVFKKPNGKYVFWNR